MPLCSFFTTSERLRPMTDAPQRFDSIPLPLPERAILKRLGYHMHHTNVPPGQRAKIDALIQEAFALCRPQGVLRILSTVEHDADGVRVQGAPRWESTRLAAMLPHPGRVLLMAATVGGAVETAARERLAAGDGAGGAIFDAVGSEVADAALGWLHEYARRTSWRTGESVTPTRFSPGYGDLALAVQRDLFDLLSLQTLGLTLTPRFLLLPEKSVTGIAGLAHRSTP